MPKASIQRLIGVAIAATLSLPLAAAAQQYSPGNEVIVLQGFKPGGGSDALAQLVQPYLTKELGVNFVNQYIPGATGAIAWTKLAKQTAADGRTISITNTPMLMTNYLMNPTIKYSIDELTPLANIVTDPGVIVVGKDSKFMTAKDFLEAARANPGRITVGNSGVGGDDYFSTIMIERASGLKFQKVPFEGDGPSWAAALAGKIDASFNNVGITFPQIKAGNLRPLAVFAEKRLKELPDVPTLSELGIKVVAGSSRGYSAPKGMPEKAKQELIAGLERVVKNPDFQKDAAARALYLDFKTGDEYARFLKEQEKAFKEIWDEVKPQAGAAK